MKGVSTSQTQKFMPKLNALRIFIVVMIAVGYASTMPLGPENAAGEPNPEWFIQLGYDPSWIGIALLFFFSGLLAMRSVTRHNSPVKYLESRVIRNTPLLFFVTLIIVVLIYPLFGSHNRPPAETFKTLTKYFLGTITCIRPGEPLPGLLDNAKYMCLIQGSIWTLKWGVIAHIAFALGQSIQLFKKPITVLALALGSILFYIIALQIHLIVRPIPGDIVLASQLAWPFLTGMAVYAYWDRIPGDTPTNICIAGGFVALACLMYFVPAILWTKAIVVSLIMGWAWLGIALLKMPTEKLSFLNNWSALALAIYLINWPVSQILLLQLPDLSSGQLIAVSLPVTVLLSFVAHKLISERSFGFARNRMIST